MLKVQSSLHSNGEINKVENKLEIALYYNKTKKANDKFNHLCHEYTIYRKTNKLAVRIFYGMLDRTAANSFVLFTLNADNQLKRFLLELSMALIKPFLT